MCRLADSKQDTSTNSSVESHETPSNYAGSNPSDAPLQAEVYSYDIGIRLGYTIYRTRYDTAFDYLPSVFTPNHSIEVIPHKSVIAEKPNFTPTLPARRDVSSQRWA